MKKLRYRLYFIFTIILNPYVPLMFHAKDFPNIPSDSVVEVHFVTCAIFNDGGILGYSISRNFYNSDSDQVQCERTTCIKAIFWPPSEVKI